MTSSELTRPDRLNGFCTVAAGLCLALVLLASGPGLTALEVIGGVPLVLIFPGWALHFAIDPNSGLFRGVQRLLWWIALSVAIVIVGGLLLNEVASLNRVAWLSYLAGWIVLGALVGWARLGSLRRSPAQEGDRGSADSVERDDALNPSRGRLSLASVGLLVLAVALGVGALALSQESVTSSAPSFLELWILPGSGAHSSSDQATVGVRNNSSKEMDIIVRVQGLAAGVTRVTHVSLVPEQTWTGRYLRETGLPVSATVRSASDPGKVVREVYLAAVPAHPT